MKGLGLFLTFAICCFAISGAMVVQLYHYHVDLNAALAQNQQLNIESQNLHYAIDSMQESIGEVENLRNEGSTLKAQLATSNSKVAELSRQLQTLTASYNSTAQSLRYVEDRLANVNKIPSTNVTSCTDALQTTTVDVLNRLGSPRTMLILSGGLILPIVAVSFNYRQHSPRRNSLVQYLDRLRNRSDN